MKSDTEKKSKTRNKKSFDEKKTHRIKKILNDKEPEANLTVGRVMFALSWFSLIFWILFKVGLFTARGGLEDCLLLPSVAIFIALYAICKRTQGKAKWLKYVLMTTAILYLTILMIVSSYRTELLYTLPVILTLRYYDTKFTMLSFGLTVLSFAVITVVCVFGMDITGMTDLNNIFFEKETIIKASGYLFDDIIALRPDKGVIFQKTILLSFLPNFVILFFITWIIIVIMKNNLSVLVLVDEYSQREADQKIELSDMQTRMMLSQIKPHFVYNTLSSIAVLCTKDPKKAKQTTINFTRYLRGNIDSLSSDDTLDFETELEHTKNYVSIEKLRFGDKINVEFDIEEADFKIPALTLQPIVENAIKHGLRKKREGGTVVVKEKKENDSHIVTITDDGVGFDYADYSKLDETHIGIRNVRKRIEQLSSGTMEIESSPGKGTKVTIKIP